jgi:hypothetical protein
MKEEKKEEPKKEEQQRYERTQIPETMREVILDRKTNVVLTDIDILNEILNKTDKIERSVV